MARKLSMTKANVRRRKRNHVEYRKFQASPKRRKYRASLNKWARKRGVYGKRRRRGLDALHIGGKIKRLGSASANRAAGARKGARRRKKR
jgi:hypothetical protein